MFSIEFAPAAKWMKTHKCLCSSMTHMSVAQLLNVKYHTMSHVSTYST